MGTEPEIGSRVSMKDNEHCFSHLVKTELLVMNDHAHRISLCLGMNMYQILAGE